MKLNDFGGGLGFGAGGTGFGDGGHALGPDEPIGIIWANKPTTQTLTAITTFNIFF